MDRPGLPVIEGSLAAAKEPPTADPQRFQEECVEAYLASWVARGFSPDYHGVRGQRQGGQGERHDGSR